MNNRFNNSSGSNPDNKLNNRNIFSVRLFWQSFKQLKAIGLISAAVMIFLTGIPIIVDGINTINMIKAANTATAAGAAIGDYSSHTSVVYPISSATTLLLVVAIITPVLALYAWSFLNKRNTSDYYHALPYKRQSLFISRFTAITAWQIVIMLAAYITFFICYHIFSKYYIVDYTTTFRIYFSEFLCALLCSAAIAFACSVTGNIFSNICLTGIIIFLPRFILMMVHSAVTSSYHAASSRHLMPLLDNSYNMLTGQFLSVFEPAQYSNISSMLLSMPPIVYTLILSLIYIIIACVLFTIRKSETAGKPALSWKLQFAIRCAIGFTISVLGTFIYVQDINDSSEYGYDSSAILIVIITFIIAAIVVIIYEMIASKKLHRVIKAIPSIIVAYILAIISGVLLNAGIHNMMSYRADDNNISYIKLSVYNEYYTSSTPDYFENVIKNVKITDKDTIKLIADAFNSNANTTSSTGYNNYYARSSSSSNKVTYEVFFKEGITGRYRIVSLKNDDIIKLAGLLTHIDEFCQEYKNLPAFDETEVSFSDYIEEYMCKDVYNTMLDEIKSMPFSDWYRVVNSQSSYIRGDVSYVTLNFTRNGSPYVARFSLSSLMPKSVAAYYNAANKTAVNNNSDLLKQMKDYLVSSANKTTNDNINNNASNNSNRNNNSSNINNNRNYSFYTTVYTLDDTDNYTIYYNDNVIDSELSQAIVKEIENPFHNDIDSTKPVVEIRYYDNNNNRSVSYYIQPAGYNKLSDYPGYEG